MNKRTGNKIKKFLKSRKISLRSLADSLTNSKGEKYSYSTLSYFLNGKLKSEFLEKKLRERLVQIKEEEQYET